MNLVPHPLFMKPILDPLERTISHYLGRDWKAKSVLDRTDFASHVCAILTDGTYPVFVKLSKTVDGLDQFEKEILGLRYLSRHAGVLTPQVIDIVAVPGGVVMVLEAVEAVMRHQRHWRDIGRTLARIHQVKGDHFGFATHNYFGPLLQDNQSAVDWPTFYAERRLIPLLRMAVESQHLPLGIAKRVERVVLRLPQICGREVTPSLLHGDAQQNNFISTDLGAVVIDPALHYGNREFDLAYVDYFEPVPAEVFDAYEELLPIDPGFAERRDLWRLAGWLAAVTVEGPSYLDRLIPAVEKYL